MINFENNPVVTTETWKNYVSAMEKNGGWFLEEDRFIDHVQYNCAGISHENGSGVFGELIEECLFVSHWAPTSMRGGVALLKEILDFYEIQVFLNVLPGKMAKMMKRLGFHSHGEVIVDYPYEMKKEVFSNRRMDIPMDCTPNKYESLANELGFYDY